MATKALFENLIYDEAGNLVSTSFIGEEAQYVIDDDGFLRHVDSEEIDRQILNIFLEQLEQNKDLAVEQMLRMMGKDDIFTKAAIDSQLKNVDMEQIIAQGIPAQARNMLGMMGFRVIINYHGEVVGLDQPTVTDEDF